MALIHGIKYMAFSNSNENIPPVCSLPAIRSIEAKKGVQGRETPKHPFLTTLPPRTEEYPERMLCRFGVKAKNSSSEKALTENAALSIQFQVNGFETWLG
jgi:hypothetical protein